MKLLTEQVAAVKPVLICASPIWAAHASSIKTLEPALEESTTLKMAVVIA